MIGSLRGTVLERFIPSTVLLEVAGVGYLCNVTSSTFGELEPTVVAFLHIHHHIREDSQTLFGFTSRVERDTFDILLATHGIGPSMAMAILSTYSPMALVTVVASGDLAALTIVPGVGKKTAELLVVELREKCAEYLGCEVQIGFPAGITGYKEVVSSPVYATAIGLLHYGLEQERATSNRPRWAPVRGVQKVWHWAREVF